MLGLCCVLASEELHVPGPAQHLLGHHQVEGSHQPGAEQLHGAKSCLQHLVRVEVARHGYAVQYILWLLFIQVKLCWKRNPIF